jgi:CheY-like chemotaxis protein
VSAADPQTIRLLFVEDAFDQALLVQEFLQEAPGEFHVFHSQDGDHAARLLREKEWHLLVTDLNLPGMDGFELCRLARSIHPSLPILAITGYTSIDYQEEAFRAGAMELLQKPLEKTDFLRKVSDLLGTTERFTRPVVLAVGGLVGDVEMGCGGTLLKHRLRGLEVVIVPLCPDERDPGDAELVAASRAARALDSRLELDKAALEDTEGRVTLLQGLVRELRPQVAYVPAMDDEHPARREAFRVAQATLDDVPLVLGYQTATTGPEFRPTRFEKVADEMMDKMDALTAYGARPDLAPRMAQAYARYWGRLSGFVEVEPFEVIRGIG